MNEEESYMGGLSQHTIETFSWCNNKKAKSGLISGPCVSHCNPELDNIGWRVR